MILNSKPAALDDAPHRSATELSILIDEADQRRNLSGCGRKTSMMAWETTLEDVMEDEDAEESEEEASTMEGTVLEEEEENKTVEEQKVIDIIRRSFILFSMISSVGKLTKVNLLFPSTLKAFTD